MKKKLTPDTHNSKSRIVLMVKYINGILLDTNLVKLFVLLAFPFPALHDAIEKLNEKKEHIYTKCVQ